MAPVTQQLRRLMPDRTLLVFGLFQVKLDVIIPAHTHTHTQIYTLFCSVLWVACGGPGSSLACSAALGSRWRAPALTLMVLRFSEASFPPILSFQALRTKAAFQKLSKQQRGLCEDVIRQKTSALSTRAQRRSWKEGRATELCGLNWQIVLVRCVGQMNWTEIRSRGCDLKILNDDF